MIMMNIIFATVIRIMKVAMRGDYVIIAHSHFSSFCSKFCHRINLMTISLPIKNRIVCMPFFAFLKKFIL